MFWEVFLACIAAILAFVVSIVLLVVLLIVIVVLWARRKPQGQGPKVSRLGFPSFKSFMRRARIEAWQTGLGMHACLELDALDDEDIVKLISYMTRNARKQKTDEELSDDLNELLSTVEWGAVEFAKKWMRSFRIMEAVRRKK
ncbi:MAG: hypothetical protein G01um101425_476 [Candidatus Peregrinibacteria bacterium Gr01-1014_25]|nr:MAG: hypothetical protein G01um101425_476 [Candidatus Peregrinibacteria bacterium Gr01-1014_25]